MKYFAGELLPPATIEGAVTLVACDRPVNPKLSVAAANQDTSLMNEVARQLELVQYLKVSSMSC